MGRWFGRGAGWVLSLALLAGVGYVTWARYEAATGRQLEAPARPPVPVRVARVGTGPIEASIFGEGICRAVRRELLTFQAAGRVTRIGADVEGREIRAGSRVRGPHGGAALGQMLAQLDQRPIDQSLRYQRAKLERARRQVASAEGEEKRALAEYDLAQQELARARELRGKDVIAASELQARERDLRTAAAKLESARAQLGAARLDITTAEAQLAQTEIDKENSNLYAPFDGVVTYLNVRVGDRVQPQTLIGKDEEDQIESAALVVIDPSAWEITFDLPAYQAGAVRTGQPAFAYLPSFGAMPGEEVQRQGLSTPLGRAAARGVVYSVSPAVNPGGRSIQVKIRTRDEEGALRDGLFVQGWITVMRVDGATMVPHAALIFRDDMASVFVVQPRPRRDGGGYVAVRRTVALGVANRAAHQILDGLEPGERVVTEGRYRLVSGAAVEIVAEEEGAP